VSVFIGVDPHKRLHAVVAVNDSGRVLARAVFPNTRDGFTELRAFGRRWRQRTWAIEGCNGVGKHLSQRLFSTGERVVDVSTMDTSLIKKETDGQLHIGAGDLTQCHRAETGHLVVGCTPAPEDLVAWTRSPIVKLFYCLRHLPGLSLEEAQIYWRTHHGPVIRSQATAMRVLRYLQVHRFEDALDARLRDARGTVVEPYTGHAELWFDRNEMGGAPSTERRQAAQRAEEDERNFIEFARSSMWFAKERVIVDRR